MVARTFVRATFFDTEAKVTRYDIRPCRVYLRAGCRPGCCTARLIAEGKTESQPLTLVMDPRMKTSEADLKAQFKISKQIYDDTLKATVALHEISMLREQMHAKARNGDAAKCQ